MAEFFRRLTLPQRLVLANVGLFLFVTIVALMLMTDSRTLPAQPPVDEISQRIMEVSEENVQIASRDALYPEFGRKNIFKSLIPTPTPTPTPEPTIPPDPSLQEAIGHWKVGGVTRSLIFTSDPRRNDEWMLDLQDPGTLSKTVRHGNEDMVVRYKSSDPGNQTVTFTFEGRHGVQEVTISMFD